MPVCGRVSSTQCEQLVVHSTSRCTLVAVLDRCCGTTRFVVGTLREQLSHSETAGSTVRLSEHEE
jgi:hypothetical protein